MSDIKIITSKYDAQSGHYLSFNIGRKDGQSFLLVDYESLMIRINEIRRQNGKEKGIEELVAALSIQK